MTAAAAPDPATNPARSTASTRRISPVAGVMLACIAIGAWDLWESNGALTLAIGVPAFAAWGMWAVYGIVAVAIIVAFQRFTSRPWTGIVLALAWGSLAATWAATGANGAASTIFLRLTGSDPHAALSSPVVEESVKAVGVIGLALIPVLRRFRPLDGLFYGVLVGAGFQVFEDAVYALSSLFKGGGDVGSMLVPMLILRGFTVGVFTHAVYTGLIGAAIGWVACAPAGQRIRRALGAVAVTIAVMAVHGSYNSQDDLTPVTLAVAFLPVVVLVVAIWRTRSSEIAFLAGEAARQDGWGELAPDEIALIGAPKPAAKTARRLRDRAIAYAWAADRLEPASRRRRHAAERLAAARSATA
jgi:RsiW-degrading membrane proteinase PrsW (M82 family)